MPPGGGRRLDSFWSLPLWQRSEPARNEPPRQARSGRPQPARDQTLLGARKVHGGERLEPDNSRRAPVTLDRRTSPDSCGPRRHHRSMCVPGAPPKLISTRRKRIRLPSSMSGLPALRCFILFAAAFIFVLTFVLRLKIPRRAGSGVRPYRSP